MAPKAVVPDVSAPVAENSKLSPEEAARVQKQLDSAIDSAFSGGQAREKANQARKRASEAGSKAERKKYEREAEEFEEEAQSQLRASQRLQSGAWQGFGAGAGMGAGTGLALGGAVGTITGGVLAVPLTAVGGLVGAGAGLVHGPWIKLTRGDKGPAIAPAEEGEPGAIELKPEEVDSISQGMKKSMGATKARGPPIRNQPRPGRRKPKKLETRSTKGS